MGIELSPASWKVLTAFACYLVGVMVLGVFAHRYLTRGSFLKEYFLGNRGLGPWVLALTVAATAISGGSFMGFPSLIYTNGWVMALWIASYMIVPLTGMALLGKRINQAARMSGAVTVPDLLRDRFDSPALGIFGSLFILLFLVFNLVAQFKAGGLVLQEAIGLLPAKAELIGTPTVDADRNLVLRFKLADGTEDQQKTPLPHEMARFRDHAVNAGDREVVVRFDMPEPPAQRGALPGRAVALMASPDGAGPLLLASAQAAVLTVAEKKVPFPPAKVRVPVLDKPVEKGYLLGLLVFAFTVIAYTTYGGFWAVTWTDVLEGLVMLVGVILLAVLAVRAVPSVTTERLSNDRGQPTVTTQELHGLEAATEHLRRQDPRLVTGPGPMNFLPFGMALSYFLMWSVASPGQPSGMVRMMSFKDAASLRRALLLICFYYVLTYVSLVVIFVCARAIFPTEYLREVGSEGVPDRIMPAMTRKVTEDLSGGSFVAGLLLAAPYAAIMSTVAAFLLMISSSLIRDLYQRTINPNVSPRTIKVASYVVTALVGVVVMIGALNPPDYLQYIIVFTGSGQSCTFLVPVALGLYWRRSTRQGMLAAMLGGFVVIIGLYTLGWTDSRTQAAVKKYEEQVAAGQTSTEAPRAAQWLQENMKWLPGWGEQRLDPFAPLYVFDLDPLVWGMLASLALGVVVSLWTQPEPKLVDKYFP